jgi:sugar lactone lactonase YvrE
MNHLVRSGFLCLATALSLLATANGQLIFTVAGGGPPNGATATAVALAPAGVVVDSAGNVYYINAGDNSVYRLAAGEVTRVAGVGGTGLVYGGDGGPATSAQFAFPAALALDAAGNLYIADTLNNRVRVVNTQSTLSITVAGVTIAPGDVATVAGNGTSGYSGDEGLAPSAELYHPAGAAVDAVGNLYIADWGNSRIREVSTSGTITTVVGTGTQGFAGDGAAATGADLNVPEGIALDEAGNLYIADTGNLRVRVVNMQPSSSITVLGVTVAAGNIATVAGNGTNGYTGDGGPATAAELLGPSGMTLDSSGDLYIADLNVVREVSVSGTITTAAGNGTAGYSGDGGPATSAQLSAIGVALDAAGDLYIADEYADRLREVNSGGTIETIAGNGSVDASGDGGPAGEAQLAPGFVTVDAAGDLYVSDGPDNRIRVVNTQANPITVLGVTIGSGDIATVAGAGAQGYSGDGGPATSAKMYDPAGVAVDKSGNLYIADFANCVIREVNTSGVISTIAGTASSCSSTGDGGPALSAELDFPDGLALDAAGNIYFSESFSNGLVRTINMQSTTQTILGVTIGPGDIAVVAGGGGLHYTGDGGTAVGAGIPYPSGLAFDASGNLYIGDGAGVNGGNPGNGIREVDAATGIITTVAGGPSGTGFSGDGGLATSALLSNPSGVVVDQNANIFIADSGNSRVRVVNKEASSITVYAVTIQPGDIETLAGDGTAGFSGDGGLAVDAELEFSSSVALDGAGNLYIGDGSLRIRKLPAMISAPPAPVITSEPSNPTATTTATFSFTDTQPDVSYLCSLDGSAYSACVSGITYSSLSSTTHNFGVEAEDPLGNVSAPATYGWTINTTPPRAPTITSEPSNPSNSTTATFDFTDTQAGVSYLCSLDGSAYSACVSGITYSSLSSTTHNFGVEAEDSLGNISAPATYGWTIKTATTPTIQWTPPSMLTYGTAFQCVLNATATASGVTVAGTYSYEATPSGGSPEAVTAKTVLPAGSYTLTVNFTPANTSQYTTATKSVALTITPATLVVSAVSETIAYGSSVPALTYTITGFVNGDTTAVVTGTPLLSTAATATSAPGSYAITITQGTLAAANYTFKLVNGTLTITKAGTRTSLTAPASGKCTSSLTVIATVASETSGTPSGTVQLYAGSKLLGSASLSRGVAKFTTTWLAPGSHSLTATYEGNVDFNASTSPPITIDIM